MSEPVYNHHSAKEWNEHVNFIAKLYLDEGLSKDQVAKKLCEKGFATSGSSVKAKLKRWGIKKTKAADEIQLLAEKFLHHRSQGQSVAFLRCGEPFPLSQVIEYIDAHPNLAQRNAELPAYLRVATELRNLAGKATMVETAATTQASLTHPVTEAIEVPQFEDVLQERPRKRRRLSQQVSPKNEFKQPTAHQNWAEHIKSNPQRRELNFNLEDTELFGHMQDEVNEVFFALETLSQQIEDEDMERYNMIMSLKQKFRNDIRDVPRVRSIDGPIHAGSCVGNMTALEVLLQTSTGPNAREENNGPNNTSIQQPDYNYPLQSMNDIATTSRIEEMALATNSIFMTTETLPTLESQGIDLQPLSTIWPIYSHVPLSDHYLFHELGVMYD